MKLKKYEKVWKRGTFFCGNCIDVTIEELKKMQNEGAIILDVRSMQEYNENHIVGSINIPIYELCEKIPNIIKNKKQKIVVYCQSGIRSKRAISILDKEGYCNLYELSGGLDNI